MEANKYPLKKAAFNLVLVYMMCFIFYLLPSTFQNRCQVEKWLFLIVWGGILNFNRNN